MIEEERLSASLEDYLEAIYHIVKDKQAAKAKDIATRLDVNSSSVTGALRALSQRGMVNYAPYDLITLTPEGKKTAKDIVRRHNTLFNFLVKVLSVDEDDAEENACRMEHVISPVILERLMEFDKFVKGCPLGGAKWVEGDGFVCERQNANQDCLDCTGFNQSGNVTDLTRS